MSADIITLAKQLVFWTEHVMSESRPNSVLYQSAKDTRDWAQRTLHECQS